FDQLLGLGLRQCRVAGRILGDELDLAPCDAAVAFFEEQGGAFLLLLAAGCERTGFDGEESDAKGSRRLCEHLPWREHADGCSAGEQGAAGDRRGFRSPRTFLPPWGAPAIRRGRRAG